jgi:hypothetical protein
VAISLKNPHTQYGAGAPMAEQESDVATKIIRVMGETDIVDIDVDAHDGGANAKLMGLDLADKINLLGHWMDQDRGEALASDPEHLTAMTAITADFLANGEAGAAFANGTNFMLLTILREKWPVGSKAKFQKIAERVGAQHTYLAVACGPAKVDDLNDDDALKKAETSQLGLALANFRRMRKQFANSSAVQTLIRQGI